MGRSQVCRQGNLGTLFVYAGRCFLCVNKHFVCVNKCLCSHTVCWLSSKNVSFMHFFREKYCGFRNLLYLCIRKNKF